MEKIDPKKFVRYKSGAKLYDMGQSKFERLAKEAKATYKINKLVLVNTQILDVNHGDKMYKNHAQKMYNQPPIN